MPQTGLWVTMLVDTGDEEVTLDPVVLNSLGVQTVGQRSIEGIGGPPLKVPQYTVLMDLSGGASLGLVQVLALPLSQPGIHDLFGQNLLL